MNILKHLFCVAALAAAGTLHATPAAAQEVQPLGVVAISSYDELMSDIDFLGSLGNQVGAGQQLEMMINMFTQNKGLEGLDKSKPIGVVLQAGGPVGFGGAVCIPVSDMKSLLGVIAPFGVQSTDKGDGAYEILAGGQTMFAREVNGWAVIAPMEIMLESLPEDPGAAIGELNETYDLAARIHVQNIPEAYRQQFFEMFSQAANQGVQQQADESDEDFAERRAAVDEQLKQTEQQLAEMDTVTLGVSIDNEQQRAFLDFLYTAVPDTNLAKTLAANASVQTQYAGFFQPDAAMMVSFAQKVDDVSMSQVEQQFAAVREQLHRSIDQEEEIAKEESKQLMKGAVDDFLDALIATLKTGAVDGGAVMTVNPEALTFVAGGMVADPGKVEAGLKKMAEASQKEELGMPEVQWDAQSYGDLTFHTVSHPAEDEDAQQLFGDTIEIAVGIGEKSVIVAGGRNWMEAVKKVLEDSKANPNKEVPPVEMIISLSPFLEVAAQMADSSDDREKIEKVATMLSQEAPQRDKIRVVATAIENGVRTRFELEEGVLRAIGVAMEESQKQQQAGAGGF